MKFVVVIFFLKLRLLLDEATNPLLCKYWIVAKNRLVTFSRRCPNRTPWLRNYFLGNNFNRKILLTLFQLYPNIDIFSFSKKIVGVKLMFLKNFIPNFQYLQNVPIKILHTILSAADHLLQVTQLTCNKTTKKNWFSEKKNNKILKT